MFLSFSCNSLFLIFFISYDQEVKVYDDIDLNHRDGDLTTEHKLVHYVLLFAFSENYCCFHIPMAFINGTEF